MPGRRRRQNQNRVSGESEFQNGERAFGFAAKKGLLEAIPSEPIMYKTTPKGEKALKSPRDIEAIYS